MQKNLSRDEPLIRSYTSAAYRHHTNTTSGVSSSVHTPDEEGKTVKKESEHKLCGLFKQFLLTQGSRKIN